MIPLHTFVRGDTLGLVVIIDPRRTVRELAAVAQEAASLRVAPRLHVKVWAGAVCLDPDVTVEATGLRPLDRIDVVPEDG